MHNLRFCYQATSRVSEVCLSLRFCSGKLMFPAFEATSGINAPINRPFRCWPNLTCHFALLFWLHVSAKCGIIVEH